MLIDASSYLFRAWFGVPDVFFDRRGRPLNAVVGFARTLGTLLQQGQPAAVAVAFDESLFSGFRHRLDPQYKANRALPDRDLARQITACRELVEGLGLVAVASREYEADDLLATLAVRAGRAGQACVIASEDKDLAQLLAGPGVQLWQYARRRVLDRAAAASWLEIDPARLPELQALTGDAGDNIPGVPGFGPVSARVVLRTCGHLDELLAEPARVATLPLRGSARLAGSLEESRSRARLNLRLATLSRRATGLPKIPALRYRPPSAETLAATLRAIGLPAGSARAFTADDQD
ncbi:MAG: 5'-3' exonuclease H3TH domain-containing protein [Gammaproteobacteria bacterium]